MLVSWLFAAHASARDAGPFWWEEGAQVVPSADPVSAIACPSASLCVAVVGDSVATSTDPAGGPGAWRVDRIDGEELASCPPVGPCGAQLRDVACPSDALCVAIDSAGHAFSTTTPAAGGGGWSGVHLAEDHRLRAVSCSSTSLCVIVGSGREALISTDPAAGASAWRRVTIDGTACPMPGCGGPAGWPSILDVACPSPTRCVAVNVAGFVLTSTAPATDPGPWTAAWVDDVPGTCGHVVGCAKAMTSVACPTPDLCVAGDVEGDGFVSTDPTGGRPTWMKIPVTSYQGPGGDGISELACSSKARCFAAWYDRVLEGSGALGGALWKPTRLGGTVHAVACPSATLCLAGGEDGTIAIGHAGPSRAQIRARLRAGLARSGAAAMRVTAPVPARIEVRWLRRGRLVARGSRTFEQPGTARIRLELTRAGARLGAHSARVRLNARATLMRPDRAAIIVKRVIRAAR